MSKAPSVFVRGLPFTLGDEELAAHFTDIAPVKRAFVIRDKATHESRGFGFVQFALDDDAQLAVQKLNGSSLAGRSISVTLAASDRQPPGAHGAAARAQRGAPPPSLRSGGAPSQQQAQQHVRHQPAPPVSAAGIARPASAPAAASMSSSGAVSAAAAAAAPAVAAIPLAPGAVAPFAAVPPALRSRTLMLLNVSSAATSKQLWVRVRKTSGAQSMAFPLSLPGSEALRVATVLYDTKASRDAALVRFDAHEVSGSVLSARCAEAILSPRDAFTRSRLIIRNLQFGATAQHIRNALVSKAAGASRTLTNLRLPLKKQAGDGGVGVGGASVIAEEEEEEEEEEEGGGEGEDVEEEGGGVEEVDAEEKMTSAAPQVPTPAHRGFAFIEFATRSDAEVVIAALNATRVHKRTVAVDWALSQNKFVAATAAAEAAAAAAGGDGDAAAPAAAGMEGPMDEDKEQGAGTAATAAAAGDDEDETAAAAAAALTAVAPVPPARVVDNDDALLGTTLFLRNVAFDTRDADLVETFRPFGPVRYARIVIDKATGRSRGTAFVQHWTKAGADRALAAAGAKDAHWEDHDAPPGEEEEETPAAARMRETYAAAVEAALLNGCIKVDGRRLLVARAVSHDEVARLAAAKAASEGLGVGGTKFDKRHTYLSHEGNIRAGSAAAEAMPPSDLEKREGAARTKKEKLKSPLFFVSPTRLSLRNLARGVDDKALLALVRAAGAAGLTNGLVDRTEGDPRLMPAPEETIPQLRVVRAKLVRETEGSGATGGATGRVRGLRTEADGLTPRSRGFAFAEFSHHIHALAALRELNNNPTYWSSAAGAAAARSAGKPQALWPRLIVEFAVENIAKVQKHDARKAAVAAKAAAMKAAAAAAGGGGVGAALAAEEGGGERGEDGVGLVSGAKRERKSRKRAREDDKVHSEGQGAVGGGAPPPPRGGSSGVVVGGKRVLGVGAGDGAAPPPAASGDTSRPAKKQRGAVGAAAGGGGTGASVALPAKQPLSRQRLKQPPQQPRATDPELDALLAGGDGGGGGGGGRRAAKKAAQAKEESRDALIQRYKAELFG